MATVMKKCIAVLFFLIAGLYSKANHVTGGEMFYTYAGTANGLHKYNVTLKFYQRCGSGPLFPNPNIISVFDRVTNNRITDISAPLDHVEFLNMLPDPCVSNPPIVCYEIAWYYFTVELPPSANGYLLSSEVNFRISGINNLAPYNQLGATYTCEIPGNAPSAGAPVNNSAKFTGSDLVIVCFNNEMSYSFSATDPDGDQLRYTFCSAYNSTTGGNAGSPSGPPPYPQLQYNAPGFSVSSPLGDQVQMDPATGLITGIAPQPGVYVITVCVEEIRNGVVIATQRKDLQVNVADCSIASAQLAPSYSLCRSTQAISIFNLSNSPLINTWNWSVFDATGSLIFASTAEELNYTFANIGTYTVKLVVNLGQPCSSQDTAQVFVYPGLVPDFDITGICLGRPTVFTDLSTTTFGTIAKWKWDFGELNATNDTSTLQNHTYTYPTQGPKNVKLLVTNSVGCRDTIVKTVTIYDKPPVGLLFKDTLICNLDPLQLQATGLGVFSWSPPVNIINANTATPTVTPQTTITYYVDMDYQGCLNRDSVRVRVVDHVTLQPMNDTSICSNDPVQLRIISDGLRYNWTPASQLNNATLQNPLATTPSTTNYQVIARIGSCSAPGNILVTVIPYPVANAGADTTICFNTTASLHGFTDGSSLLWSPAATLSNAVIPDPIARPVRTTAYILNAFDTRGCPKPGRDTVLVTVLAPMNISAGRDTAVIIGESLHFNASGADNYTWSPPNYLSSTTIADPIGTFTEGSNGILYKVVGSNTAGCTDSAYITVRVFATGPYIFVPTGFTPNNDGRNDILRPIAVGMKEIQYFRVFNRWGQLVFDTRTNGQGWDGKVGGQLQSTNSFVWEVSAIDYRGALYFRKGVVTLIR
jgi:gliding motility-associated-like protein